MFVFVFLSVFFSLIVFLSRWCISFCHIFFQDMNNLNSIFSFLVVVIYILLLFVPFFIFFSNASAMHCARENIYRQYCWLGFFFSAFGGDKLRQEPWYRNDYFTTMLVYMGLFFTPCGSYLIKQFPAWETMFIYGNDEVSALLCAFFTFIVLFCSIIGFYVGYHMKPQAALAFYVHGHVGFYGLAGIFYNRFLNIGTGEDWARGVEIDWREFFGSELCYTILVMYPYIHHPLHFFQTKWFYQAGHGKTEPLQSGKLRLDYSDQLSLLKTLLQIWIHDVIILTAPYMVYLFWTTGLSGVLRNLLFFWAFECLFPIFMLYPWLVPWPKFFNCTNYV